MAQAEAMKKNLRQIRTETKVVQKTGTLDGVRTSRHVFYLMSSEGPEITGAVSEDMIFQMKDYLNQRVSVNLDRTTVNSYDGKRPKHTYRLISIQPIQPDETLFGADNPRA